MAIHRYFWPRGWVHEAVVKLLLEKGATGNTELRVR